MNKTNKFKQHFYNLYPEEWVTIIGIIVAGIGGLFFDLPLVKPDILSFYAYLLFFAPSFYIILLLNKKKNQHRTIIILFRIYLTFLITAYLCLATKYWQYTLHEIFYDDIYLAFDIWLSPLINIEKKVSSFLKLPDSVDAYILVYRYMFWAVFPICYFKSKKLFHYCSTALAINLILGGLSYNIAPALGPFIYSDYSNNETLVLYYETTQNFINNKYNSNNFVFILGAMPSMHVSTAALFSWFLWKAHKVFGILGGLCTIYFFMHAKFTGLHYSADLFAGIALTIICVLIARWVIKKHPLFSEEELENTK